MEIAKTPEQALSHLFFHCCKKDGVFDTAEIDFIAAKFVELDLNRNIDFKNEVLRYAEERRNFTDEHSYLVSLIRTIKPANTLALFSFCVEICLSDQLMSMEEMAMLDDLALILDISEVQKDAIKALMVERKVVLINKII